MPSPSSRFLIDLDCDPADGVGSDRYKIHARWHLGTDLDPIEAYEWAWDEFERTEQQLPWASIHETVAALMQNSSDVIVGPERYSDWARTVWEDARRVLAVDDFDGRLIEFEFAGFRHALADVVCLYVPGPMWITVGDPISSGLESEYREALSRALPEATDEGLFGFGITMGCLAFAVERLNRLPKVDTPVQPGTRAEPN